MKAITFSLKMQHNIKINIISKQFTVGYVILNFEPSLLFFIDAYSVQETDQKVLLNNPEILCGFYGKLKLKKTLLLEYIFIFSYCIFITRTCALMLLKNSVLKGF